MLHGIDEAAAVDEPAAAFGEGAEKERQLFGHDGEIGIEYQEHVAASGAETGPDVLGFADARAADQANLLFGVKKLHAPDFAGGAVGGFVVAKKNFGAAAHARDALNSRLNVTGFVATRNDDRSREVRFLSRRNVGPRDNHLHQAQAAQARQSRHEIV